jgi:predicted S18 family serine protease
MTHDLKMIWVFGFRSAFACPDKRSSNGSNNRDQNDVNSPVNGATTTTKTTTTTTNTTKTTTLAIGAERWIPYSTEGGFF